MLSMPSRWSIWDKGKPAGASPMIATCLRAAIFMSIQPNGAAAVKKSQSHGDATWPYRRCGYPELGRPDRPVRDHDEVGECRGGRERRANQQRGHEGARSLQNEPGYGWRQGDPNIPPENLEGT